MKRGHVLIIASVIVVAIITLAFTQIGYANPAAAPAGQAAPLNDATVDITFNDAGGLSIGGINLSTLGVAPLSEQVINVVKGLKDVHLLVEGSAVNVDVQGTPLVNIAWSSESRKTSASLATRYGVQLTDQMQARIEQWVSNSKFDVTARYANEASKPAVIGLTTPVQVDIAQNGQLTIESIPLAAAIDQSALQTIMLGGKQVTLCWAKGRINAAVDGAALPTITLNPEGVQVLNTALNLNITEIKEPLLASRFGVDLSLPGGSHDASAACTQ